MVQLGKRRKRAPDGDDVTISDRQAKRLVEMSESERRHTFASVVSAAQFLKKDKVKPR